MLIPNSIFSKLARLLIKLEAWKVTKYYSEKEIARATRRMYGGKIPSNKRVEVEFTLGRPNFEEREFIKKCKKAGEPFPVKKIQIRYPPKKK